MCLIVYSCVFPYYDMYTHIFIYIYMIYTLFGTTSTTTSPTTPTLVLHSIAIFKPFQINSFQDSPQQFFIPIVQRMELGCLEMDFLSKWGGLENDSQMGVSENRGTPKWMVSIGKTYWNGWFGGTTIFGNIQIDSLFRSCSLDMFGYVSLTWHFKDILFCHTHLMVSIMLLTKNCWVGRWLNGVSDEERLMLERRKSTMMT